MLQIILLILKIIGLILLAVLGLIILILAAPVCYHVSGCWKEEKQVHVRISWLYYIAGVMIDSNGQAPEIKIRIFGKILGQEKEKKKKPQKKKKKVEMVSPEPSSEKANEVETDVSQAKPVKEETKPVQKAEEPVKEETKPVQKAEEPVKEETKSVQKAEEPIKEEESLEPIVLSDEEVHELEMLSRESRTSDFPSSADNENKKGHPKKKKASEHSVDEEKKTNPALEMAKTGWDFIQNPNVKKLLKKLWKSICRILHHILPRKLNVKAHLGFEDPALNGRIAEAAAVLYAFYPKQFELVSDFEEEIIEVEGNIRGWFVPGYLLLAVIGMGLRVVLNRECRMLYKNIKAKR